MAKIRGKTPKSNKKFIIIGVVILLLVGVGAAITLLISKNGDSSIGSLFKKEPTLKDGKYCAITNTYHNLNNTIVYNYYDCVEVANQKTYTQVKYTHNPPALTLEKSMSATYQFDLGDKIEIKNDSGEVTGTIEQLDEETLLVNTSGDKLELSINVEEDTSNQAEKE